MNRVLALAEWKRALQALGAARSCWRGGYHADALSRAYYATFHGAKAALHMRGVSAERHTAVRRLFGTHLVETQLIEGEWATLLAESSDARVAADYDVEAEVSEDGARQACERGQAFLVRIREFIVAAGVSPADLGSPIVGD